jgi:DNA recombination protein RmuC
MAGWIGSLLAGLAALVAAVLAGRAAAAAERARLVAEQARDAVRSEAETSRRQAEAAGRDLTDRLGALRGAQDLAAEQLRTALAEGQGALRLALTEAREAQARASTAGFEDTRTLLETRLRELREGNEAKLAEIQRGVNEQLHAAVEKQMTESFNRVIDQFAAVQKALGEFSVLSSQMGDIKRLFSNVKTRGGWGEAQLRAMLEDVLPAEAFETNARVRPGSDEVVEFALRLPGRGEARPLLPIDAKFPVEDYERLLSAADAGDAEAERDARRRLEQAVRVQARRIAEKYISPPVTVDYAVMYLPTDGLFAEVARLPGLIDSLGRDHHVMVLGPSLFPALLRTIHLGHITLAIERNAEQVRGLLGATLTEMGKMDEVLGRLEKNAGTMTKTIGAARTRTRAVSRKLRGVAAAEPEAAAALLELDTEPDDEAEAAEE